jgi:hypothetical protein
MAVVLAAAAVPSAGAAEEGRAYEQVSPPDKAGSAVRTRGTIWSAPSGDAVAYGIPGALPGSSSATLANSYGARRSSTGWSVEHLDAPIYTPSNQVFFPILAVSEDLNRVVQFSGRALAPGAIEGGGNLYLQDRRTGARTLIAASTDIQFQNEVTAPAARRRIAITPDLSHFVFSTTVPLTPDAVAGQVNA